MPTAESQVRYVVRWTAPPVQKDSGRTGPDSARRSFAAIATVPVLLIVLSVWTVVSSLGLGYWTPIGPGAGFFPLWLAVLLGAMSAVWLLQQLRARSAPPEPAEELEPTSPEAEAMEGPSHEEPVQYKTVFAILGSLIAVTALLEVLGFQLAMLLFLLFQLKVLARRGWALSVGLAVAGSFGVFVLFTQFLTVTLPTSSIPLLRSMGL
jgi:putative tricarboxylic transport membrane protein